MALFAGRPACLTLVGVLGALLWLAALGTAEAADALPVPPTRLAAVSNSPTHAPDLQQTRTLRSEDAWLLVQGTQPNTSQAVRNEETIITQFPLSAPEGVEEEVAEAYGLELVDRSILYSLEMRIARYRVPQPMSLAKVLELLRRDQRVASAQLNVRYARPVPPAQDTEIGVASKPEEGAPQAQGDKGSASRAVTSNRKTAPQQAPDRNRLASANARPPQRGGEVADLLAGGL